MDTNVELMRLHDAVDAFADEMKKRLEEQLVRGYTGWDKSDGCRGDLHLCKEIAIDACDWPASHPEVRNKKTIDIANRAMFLWFRKRT